MGFWWSPVLCLHFALIRKFSVSQDNAALLKNAFTATGVHGPRSASALGVGTMWVRVSRCLGLECAGGSHGPLLAHKCIYAPLTPCRPEGQMGKAEPGKEGACGSAHLAPLQER